MRHPLLDDQGSVRNGWKVLGFLALMTSLGTLFGIPLSFLPPSWRLVLPWQGFSAASVLLAAWICLRMEDESLGSLGLNLDPRFLGELALGTLGGFGLMVATAAIIWALGGWHWVRTPDVGSADLLKGAWLYFAVAWFEETLFRGYPFQRAVRGLGFTGAQATFAVLFAVAHWGNPGMAGATKVWATLNIGLAAILLAFCWRRTGSLALPIGVHLGWNWTQGNLLGFGVSGTENRGWWTPVYHGRPDWLTGGTFGLEGSLVCALLCGAVILGLWRWPGRPSADASTASVS
jgi:hypothetical protein